MSSFKSPRKLMYYVRSGGQTVGIYANSRKEAKDKFISKKYTIDSSIVSVDEWLSMR